MREEKYEGEIPVAPYSMYVRDEKKADLGEKTTHYDLVGNTPFKDWIVAVGKKFDNKKVIITIKEAN